jgi:hypothetical protein
VNHPANINTTVKSTYFLRENKRMKKQEANANANANAFEK